MTYGLDRAEARQLFHVAHAGHRQIFQYVVLVYHAGHHLKRAHIEHVHVARLEADEQVAVVVEQRERRQAGVVDDFGLELILLDLFD